VTAFSNKQVEMAFCFYPEMVRLRMHALRKLVFETAERLNVIDHIEESLKWGEPSYIAPKGSTIRMGWKATDPDFYRLYFHCQTSLVSTFRKIHPHLDFEGNRNIKLSLNHPLDPVPLGHCIELALNYHSLKHLPLLGATI
jgi:hypothetical protein